MKSTDPTGWGCAPLAALLGLLELARLWWTRRRACRGVTNPRWPNERFTYTGYLRQFAPRHYEAFVAERRAKREPKREGLVNPRWPGERAVQEESGPRFRVGDRVRLVRDGEYVNGWRHKAGTRGVITTSDGLFLYRVDIDEPPYSLWAFDDDVEREP